MSEKWTPGPWSEFKYVGPADSWFIRGPNGERVCGSGSGPVSKVNAHLIAAAPDLYGQIESTIVDLELLRDAVDDGDPRPELLIRIDDIVRRSRAALRRARGEQP